MTSDGAREKDKRRIKGSATSGSRGERVREVEEVEKETAYSCLPSSLSSMVPDANLL